MDLRSETPGSAAAASAPSILVVDDDDALRMLFERYLVVFGYRPLFARNGDEAICVARAMPDIQLIILDLIMPGLSGRELAGQLEKLLPRARVLVCSGHPANAAVRMGIDIPGAQFMQKPCRPLELKQRLSEMLASR